MTTCVHHTNKPIRYDHKSDVHSLHYDVAYNDSISLMSQKESCTGYNYPHSINHFASPGEDPIIKLICKHHQK